MNTKLVSVLAVGLSVALAGPVFAHHKSGHSAPGQQAKEVGAPDVNGDGRVNGKDFAPGQNK